MRLEIIYEGKAIILSKEAYAFATKVAAKAYDDFKYYHAKITKESPEYSAASAAVLASLGSDMVSDKLILHSIYSSDETRVEIVIAYTNSDRTEGAYIPNVFEHEIGRRVKIELSIGCAHPKLHQDYIREIIIHEMTHAVDPKIRRNIPGALADIDVNKIKHGTEPEARSEFYKYARQPVEVEAIFYQIASRFVRYFVGKGASKAELFDKVKRLTPDILDEVYNNHAYAKKLGILLGNKTYRRKLINTIIHIINKIDE